MWVEDMDGNLPDRPSPNLYRVKGGELRWVYEFSFWRRPVVLLTTWLVLLFSSLVPFLLVFFASLGDEGFWGAVGLGLPVFGLIVGFVSVLCLFAYLILGLVYGGKYLVLFKMDDRGVSHVELPRRFRRGVSACLLAAALGLSSGSMVVERSGLLSVSRLVVRLAFARVRLVKILEGRNVIILRSGLVHIRLVARSADFAYVRDFVLSRCPEGVKVRVVEGPVR